MNIIGTIKETFADGPGIRYAIYCAGCRHACKGCHNPQSWDFNQGASLDKALPIIIKEIKANPMLTGITISGGDPFYSREGLLLLLKTLKKEFPDKDVWVYTGFTLEQLDALHEQQTYDCLELIDVLVDGKYIEALRDTTNFKGSTNQRIIENPIKKLEKSSLL